MSIEDRSLDALKEEGTATVIDGSDDEKTTSHPLWLCLDTEGYVNIDRDGSLKANVQSRDDANNFKVHIMESDPHQIVMLEPINNYKFVAIKKENNSATVITKEIPPGTFKGFTNLSKVETNHPDILFQKIPWSEGSQLFQLKPYRDDTQMVGLKSKGDHLTVTTADPESKFLFKTCN